MENRPIKWPAPALSPAASIFVNCDRSGFVSCGNTLEVAIANLINMGCPIDFEEVEVGGQRVYVANWNVPFQRVTVDGEGQA
jgi:hypothetical protein